MPAGVSPDGILVRGYGFGPRNRGDISTARAKADGSFTMPVASDHGYTIGLVDSEWASDSWTGMILADDTAAPAEIELDAYASTPCEVQVYRGDPPAAVPNALIEVDYEHNWSWRAANGKERNAVGGRRFWMRTDEKGLATAGVGRGKLKFSVRQDDWAVEKEVSVQDEKAFEVLLYHP